MGNYKRDFDNIEYVNGKAVDKNTGRPLAENNLTYDLSNRLANGDPTVMFLLD